MTALFWFSIFAVVYAYFGYPAALFLLSRYRRRKIKRDSSYRPAVSFIVTVHNEEKRIKDKITNTLALDYPPEKLEIIFASDASTDATDDIVNGHTRLKLVRPAQRKGKEYAQKCAIDQSSGEILVFSDVATILKENAIANIVANFADASVGCVSSVDRFIEEDGSLSGEGAYVRYEMFLRKLESEVNTLVGLSGSFFAARRVVCNDWAIDLQSDFNTVLNSMRRNLKGILDFNTAGYYKNIADEKKEFHRKVRTVLRGISVLAMNLSLLNPLKYGLFSWQLFSHKLCRWLVPFFLSTAFLSNIILLFSGGIYTVLFFLQILFYALAGSCILFSQNLDRANKLIKIPYYFIMVNGAIAVAWWKFFKGQRAVFWQPTER